MKNINLKEVVIQEDSNKNNLNEKDNYDIYLTKKDLNSIIFSLNALIVDIQNNQDQSYLKTEIEKIIFKLKIFDIPPELQLKNMPTFLSIKKEGSNTQEEDNKDKLINALLKLNLKNIEVDTKTYYSNDDSESQNIELDKYEGDLVNGKKEGKGKYKYKNGCIYEGFFKNNKKDGKGIFYYTNGDRYKGQFEKGFYQGNGIFYFHNGDRYEGEFVKNKYSGLGKYFYHNGDIFEGLWENDKKNGKGTYIYLNGDKISGNYLNGKPIGIHVKFYDEGKQTQIRFSDDK